MSLQGHRRSAVMSDAVDNGLGRAAGRRFRACRKYRLSTFCNWKAKFGGMEVSGAKRLRALEDENAELNRLLTETMLDVAQAAGLVRQFFWRRRFGIGSKK